MWEAELEEPLADGVEVDPGRAFLAGPAGASRSAYRRAGVAQLNLRRLHQHLVAEHGYAGSLRSLHVSNCDFAN